MKTGWAISLTLIALFWGIHAVGQTSPANIAVAVPGNMTPENAEKLGKILYAASALSAGPSSDKGPQMGYTEMLALQLQMNARFGQLLGNKGAKDKFSFADLNNQPQDFYGRVVDQHGQPLAGFAVNGTILRIQEGNYAVEKEPHQTTTDAGGLFQFVGLRGIELRISLQNPGFDVSNQASYLQTLFQNPPSKPETRATFTVYKLQGAEPMFHAKSLSWLPANGTPVCFDLSTGKPADAGGLQISLKRNPVQIPPHADHFDWTIKIKFSEGGLIASLDPYPCEAPQNGYQPGYTFNEPKDAPQWTPHFSQTFYIRIGKSEFGRVSIQLFADNTFPQGVALNFEIWINPSGSRNLEFDPTKQLPSTSHPAY